MKPLATILLLTAITSLPVRAQQPQMYDARSKINVTGEAVVNVRPDKIAVTLGIETSDPDISAAKQKNNEIMRKAVAAIRECGVPDKDIQTDLLSIEPRYRNDYQKEVFLGYFVRNGFVVSLNEAEKLEGLLTKVLQAGVNYVHNVDFQTTEFKKYREQARELALKAAKEKADKMASVLGQSVGLPLQITENYSGSPWTYYSSWGGRGSVRNAGMAQNVVQDIRSGSEETLDTIALGKIAIRANVSVTFELKR